MIMIPALASMSTHCLHLSDGTVCFAAAKITFFIQPRSFFQKSAIFAAVLWRFCAAVHIGLRSVMLDL
jgi:hypothetical protein